MELLIFLPLSRMKPPVADLGSAWAELTFVPAPAFTHLQLIPDDLLTAGKDQLVHPLLTSLLLRLQEDVWLLRTFCVAPQSFLSGSSELPVWLLCESSVEGD